MNTLWRSFIVNLTTEMFENTRVRFTRELNQIFGVGFVGQFVLHYIYEYPKVYCKSLSLDV